MRSSMRRGSFSGAIGIFREIEPVLRSCRRVDSRQRRVPLLPELSTGGPAFLRPGGKTVKLSML